ncbi:MAG: hypothetical protein WC820_02270 [Spirochaetales bacterium]
MVRVPEAAIKVVRVPEAAIRAVRALEAVIREETIREEPIQVDIRAIPVAAREAKVDTKAPAAAIRAPAAAIRAVRAAIRVPEVDTKAAKVGTRVPAADIRAAIEAISLMIPIDPDLKALAVTKVAKAGIRVRAATKAVRVATKAVRAAQADTRGKGHIRAEGRVDTLAPDPHTLRGRAAILRAVLDLKVQAVPEPQAAIVPATPRREEDLPDALETFLAVRDPAVTGHAAPRTVPHLLKAARQPSASQLRGESPDS